MGHNFRLTQDDSSDIAFAENCLMSGAISQDELRQWLYHVIESADDIPTFVFDLLDTKDLRIMFRGLNGPLGFFPCSDLNTGESDAITGIAYKRGYYDGPRGHDVYIDRDTALAALEQNAHILKRFRDTFPFVEI